MSKIMDRSALQKEVQKLQQSGKKVVFTNGCFDILHVGHVRYLQAARAQGDVLVVGLNTDSSVQRLKGPTRPINAQDDRAEVLAGLACVDYVTLFDEPTPEVLIALLRPDVHVKGGDYTEDQLPEAKIVREYGGDVVIMPLVEGRSTTNVIKKISNGASASATA